MRQLVFVLALASACTSNGLGSSVDMSRAAPATHRAVASACTVARGPGNVSSTGDLGFPPSTCHDDSDCTAGLNGRCIGDPHDGWQCSYDACTSDSDCPTGTLCDCRSPWHKGRVDNAPTRCLPTNCHTDADCGTGQYCAPSFGECGSYSGVIAWACTTTKDTCRSGADCDVPDGAAWITPYCVHDPNLDRWACSISQCAG